MSVAVVALCLMPLTADAIVITSHSRAVVMRPYNAGYVGLGYVAIDAYTGDRWLARTHTDADGNFTFDHLDLGDDGNHFAYNVVLTGPYVRVSPPGPTPYAIHYAATIIGSPPWENGAFQISDFIHLDGSNPNYEATYIFALLTKALQLLPAPPTQYICYTHPSLVTQTDGTATDGIFRVAWNQYFEEHFVYYALGKFMLNKRGDLTGMPGVLGPQGESNPSHAWDSGAASFFASVFSQAAGTTYPSYEAVVLPTPLSLSPSIGNNVTAALYDLWDTNIDDDAGPGRDATTTSLASIAAILDNYPISDISAFWYTWVLDGRPTHLPLLAMRQNGMDYNTPPVWTTIPNATHVGATFIVDVAPWVTDDETPDNQLQFTAQIVSSSSPVTTAWVGSVLHASMGGGGTARLRIQASDELAPVWSNTFDVTWQTGGGDPPFELEPAPADMASIDTEPRLWGDVIMRGRGSVEFSLPRSQSAAVRVYSLDGRRVATLVEGDVAGGRHRVEWDGRAANGAGVASGVYLVSLEGAGLRRSIKVHLLR